MMSIVSDLVPQENDLLMVVLTEKFGFVSLMEVSKIGFLLGIFLTRFIIIY